MDNLILNLQNYKDFKNFKNGISMIETFKYENEYIKVLRIDASNKWTGIPHESDMDKQWGIIIDIKKDFRCLQNYKKLTTVLDLDITPVHRGENKGKYGIRIYHMAQNPNEEIVQQILNYIFE